jgi:iron complex outermembrane receptor protein
LFTWRQPAVAGLLALGLSLSAAAEDQSGATAGSANGAAELADIIVTAQRVTSSLEQTPVAIAVMSGDALERQQITSEEDLQIAVPGLTVRASANSDQLNYAIRGQSLDAFSGSPPGVLPYVNEVQIGGAGVSSAFFDLQSVQVLKGPQGTLFGRNATGGAVLFTTNKPTDDLGGYISVRGGDYSLRQVEGALNVPLVPDRLLVRVAGFMEEHTGYQYNLYTDSNLGDVDRYNLRLSITARFTDEIHNDLVTEYAHSGGSSLVGVLYSIKAGSLIPSVALYSPGLDASFGPGAWAAYLAAHPRADPAGLVAFFAEQQARGPFLTDVDSSVQNLADNLILSDSTVWEIGPHTQLKNVFGFNDLRSLNYSDIDGSPYGILGDNQLNGGGAGSGHPIWTRQFSEELQLSGKTLDDQLTYVTGLYYAQDRQREDINGWALDLAPFIEPSLTINDGLTRHRINAGYAQGTYDLAKLTSIDGLGVTAGVRYTSENNSLRHLPDDLYFPVPDSPTFQKYQEFTTNKPSWQFGVQEQLNSELLLYVVTRRSFKDGGYNIAAPPNVGIGSEGGNRFLPETATDVELGLKYQGLLAQLPTRFNIAIYDEWVLDQQHVAYALLGGSLAAVTVNIPKARVEGVETDGQISLTSWLKVGATMNFTNAAFVDDVGSVLGQVTVFGPYPDSARWSGSVYGDAAIPLPNNLTFTVHGDAYDQSGTYFSPTANTLNPGTHLPGYAVANFATGLENPKQGWSVTANVRNAFNHVYYVGGIGDASLAGVNTAVPGAPRTWSVEARYKF